MKDFHHGLLMFEPRSRRSRGFCELLLLDRPFYGWWDFALRSVGARHAVPKGWPFYGCPRTPVVSFRRPTACGGRAGLGVGQEIGRANG